MTNTVWPKDVKNIITVFTDHGNAKISKENSEILACQKSHTVCPKDV